MAYGLWLLKRELGTFRAPIAINKVLRMQDQISSYQIHVPMPFAHRATSSAHRLIQVARIRIQCLLDFDIVIVSE